MYVNVQLFDPHNGVYSCQGEVIKWHMWGESSYELNSVMFLSGPWSCLSSCQATTWTLNCLVGESLFGYVGAFQAEEFMRQVCDEAEQEFPVLQHSVNTAPVVAISIATPGRNSFASQTRLPTPHLWSRCT